MNRQKIPQQTETQLLQKCRRRCCMCFALERDARMKQGQIAHLDQNKNNNSEDNLAFLCLSHHDLYDTKASQSKSFTISELKVYRSELYKYVVDNWNRPILETNVIKVDFFTGSYTSGNDFESSDLEVTFLGGNLIHVKGIALWGKSREYGPHTGELDFVTELNINKATFVDKLADKTYKLELEFLGEKLIIIEDYVSGYFGMNVSFGGEYYKRKF